MPQNEIPTEEPSDDVALQAKVDQLERQVADYKALLAEQMNSTKRLRDDADRQRKYASEPLAKDLLSILDNLDWAIKAAQQAGDQGPLAKGVQATINLFLSVLERHGVKRVDVAPGSAFDPNLHTAVMEQPTNDFEVGTVAAITQNGFLLHDKLIRPAAVVVAKEPPAGGELE